jgi:hypothetical protein
MAGLVSAFSGSFDTDHKVAQFVIAPLTNEGQIDTELGAKVLQYWPESISDGKSAEWQSRTVPGLPVPLYQWVAGGERSLSFDAAFSRDMKGQVGVDIDEDKHNVDIDAAIAWLRLMVHNDYGQVGDVQNAAIAPPVLWMCGLGTSQESGMKMGYNTTVDLGVPNELGTTSPGVYVHMMECGAERKNWFNDGTTRYSAVSLSFSETIQIAGGLYPYGRSDFVSLANGYTRMVK